MAKIPVILEAGRADGKLIKTNNVYDDNQEKFLSEKIKEIDYNHNDLKDEVNALTEVVNTNKSNIEKLDEMRDTVIFTGATVYEETEMLVLNRVDEETLVLDEVNGTLSGGITKVSQLENDKGYLTGAVEGESIMLNND